MEELNKQILKKDFAKNIGQAIFALTGAILCVFATLPYSVAPFGIGICCNNRKSKWVTVSVYLGVICAYIFSNASPVYIGAVIFTVPLKMIVNYFLPSKRLVLAPSISALISLLFLYATLYIQYGMLNFDLITGIFGVIAGFLFAAVADRSLKIIFSPSRLYGADEKDTVNLLLFFATLLTAFTNITIVGLSIGKVISVALILLFSLHRNGFLALGASLTFSAACTVGSPESAYLIPCYGLSAILLSLIPKDKKYLRGILYLGIFSLVALYFSNEIGTLRAITEVSVGSGIYVLLPNRLTDLLQKKFISQENKESKIRQMIIDKLTDSAASIKDISNALLPKEVTAMNIYAKVRETEDNFCKTCKNSPSCWGENFSFTRDVFNKAANIIKKTADYKDSDMPDYFNCIKKDKLIMAFKSLSIERKNELIKMGTVENNRKILAAQYESIGSFIDEICKEIAAISKFDENSERIIGEYFDTLGIPNRNITVYYDKRNALHIEISFMSEKKIFEHRIATDISKLLDRSIICDGCINQDNLYSMKFIQQEKYSLTVAQTNRNKDGEKVCGDSFATFKSKSYHQILALSDGMGSGNEADKLSSLTLNILKNLLQNGFGEEKACALVNSTLLLGGDGQSFSTLDMASINLFNGRADFYKFGAAPTLILRKGRAYEIFCASLPAGIIGDSKAEHRNCKLRDGDIIIMLSDGVDVTKKILDLCKENANENPITLCERIMENATVDGKADDDMTVAIAKINLKKSA